ncbi:MAG: hypothetical protein J2P30_16260 [Actinobacteria bacterium]|nr:hypothetical protein [Actinomycetota bacterium]
MTAGPAHLEHARKVADAVLYEGYVLYPYRRSAQKNRTRFQFGVLMPPPYRAVDEHEPSASQTECLMECPADAELDIGLRCLHLQRRTAQLIEPGTGAATDVDTLRVGETDYSSWDEAVEREQHFRGCVADLLDKHTELPFEFGESAVTENLAGPDGEQAGRLLRRCEALAGAIVVRAERTAGPYGAIRLRVRVENRTEPRVPLRSRDDGLKYALIAAHLLIGVAGGSFLSLTDPPEWAAGEVAACVNVGAWPVLAGPPECRDLMLSSPVILYDHPEVAPESAGDLFDATEIDEILTLRTLALTDEERQEARATDPRAADLIDRLDDLPPEMLERMHGAIRYLSPGPGKAPAAPPTFTEPGESTPAPWWDPGSDTSVSPETDHVLVAGVTIARGSRVRMRPGARRTDAQDLFLTGREALVEAVLHDVDGQVHVAVSPVSDPLAELQRNHGRFLYFAPDELEPVEAIRREGTQ